MAVELDEFTREYIEAALWSTNDESDESGGEPLDANYSASDIDRDTLAEMVTDCAQFQDECAELLVLDNLLHTTANSMSQAGHDFWLTRNGHGCGFWDGDWEDAAGEKLSDAACRFGEVNLYVGDDGKIYS